MHPMDSHFHNTIEVCEMSFFGGIRTRSTTPWASILTTPLDYIQMPIISSGITSNTIPWTSILTAPFDDIQMSLESSI
jgi:hypothetical protein